MKNLLFNIKKFLANKNTVTVLGVFLGVLVLYFGYNFRVQQAIKPQRIPYALKTIQPRQKITEDMVGYVDVPPAMIVGNVIKGANLIIGKYANYNTLIPEGSLFFSNAVISATDLPDSSFIDIPEGYVPFSLPVTVESTYGNSIFPGNYINLYLKALDPSGKIMIGKLVENVKILDVKDSKGQHVFENTEDARTPSTLIFAVPEELHLLLRKAYYLSNVSGVNAVLIPVPNTLSYTGEVGAIAVANQYLKNYIELQTSYVPEDQLPDLDGNDDNNTEDNNNENVTQ